MIYGSTVKLETLSVFLPIIGNAPNLLDLLQSSLTLATHSICFRQSTKDFSNRLTLHFVVMHSHSPSNEREKCTQLQMFKSFPKMTKGKVITVILLQKLQKDHKITKQSQEILLLLMFLLA